MSQRVIRILRWTARIAGGLMVALLLFIIVGESLADGPIPVFQLTTTEQIELVATVVMMTGAVAAWRWERIGGWVSVIGGTVFVVTEAIEEKAFSPIWFPLVFVAVGVVFIVCSAVSKDFPTRKAA